MTRRWVPQTRYTLRRNTASTFTQLKINTIIKEKILFKGNVLEDATSHSISTLSRLDLPTPLGFQSSSFKEILLEIGFIEDNENCLR